MSQWPRAMVLFDLWPADSTRSCWRSEGMEAAAAPRPLPVKRHRDLLGFWLPKISRMELNLSLAKKDVWFLIVRRPKTSLPASNVHKHRLTRTHKSAVSVIHGVGVCLHCSDPTYVVAHQARTWKLWVATDVEERRAVFFFGVGLTWFLSRTPLRLLN